MVLSIDFGLAALIGSAFATGALLKPLLLWFGLKALGKIAGPMGIWAGVVAAVAILLLHLIGALDAEEHKTVLIGLFLVLAAAIGALWLWPRGRSSPAVHQELSQTMDGDGAGNRVQTSGHGSPVTIQNGVSAEQLATLLAQANAPLVKQAEQFGILKGTIIALAKRWEGSTAETAEQALKDLEYLVGLAINVQSSPDRMANEDALLREVLARAASQSGAGNYAAALAAIDSGLVEVDRRDTEQRDARQRQRIKLHEEAIQIALLSGDISTAAVRVEALANVLEPSPRPPWTEACRILWNRYYEEGRDLGVNISLDLAIALARRMRACATNRDERGIANNLIGLALQTLGAREPGTASLAQAVIAFRLALTELGRDRVPQLWAGTQNNLGATLRILGERETNAILLEEAVTAFRSALEEYNQSRNPFDWAMTQGNLGVVLTRLGERDADTVRLEEAIVAYRSAMDVYTRARNPQEWATTQNNLGAALQTLGARGTGTLQLEQAVTAYREALKERTQRRVPLLWAATQNNLGNALATLAERESGTTSLNQAVVAYREALKETTRERAPLDWAGTQNNLGNALRLLGERDVEMERIREAIIAYSAALEEFTPSRAPYFNLRTRQNLARAEALLAAKP